MLCSCTDSYAVHSVTHSSSAAMCVQFVCSASCCPADWSIVQCCHWLIAQTAPCTKHHLVSSIDTLSVAGAQVRFWVLLPVAVACWAAAATLAPQFCADNTVAWLGLTDGRCVAAAMALQVPSVQPSLNASVESSTLCPPCHAMLISAGQNCCSAPDGLMCCHGGAHFAGWMSDCCMWALQGVGFVGVPLLIRRWCERRARRRFLLQLRTRA